MKEPILFANGCSMTYGSELFDDPETKLCLDNPSRFAMSWPGVLGKELGFSQIINLGFPGSSNDRIVRTTIEWTLKNYQKNSDNLFVVIGWSSPMRKEFFVNGEWRQIIPYHDYSDPPLAMLNRIYREVAWNEIASSAQFGVHILSLQSFLLLHKIPYLFFDAITSFHQTNIDSERALDLYLPHIKKEYYLNLDKINGDMASQTGCDLSKTVRHPDINKHSKWAKQLADFIRWQNLLPASFNLKAVLENQIMWGGTGTVEIMDRKIGLPSRPLASVNNPVHKEKGWGLLRRARNKDPFIYE